MKVVNQGSEAASKHPPLAEFKFNNHIFRTVLKDGVVWFVATDVCEVLEHSNPTKALLRLDEDQRDLIYIQTPGRQELNIINESGLYALMLTSRKPKARPFRKWITNDILPSIRKTGRYETRTADAPEIEQQAPAQHFRVPEKGIWTIIVEEDRSFRIGSIDSNALTKHKVHEYGAFFQAKLSDPASAMNNVADSKSPFFEEDSLIEVAGIIHLAGAMGSVQTVLPFKLAATDDSLTAHGGLAPFGEYLRAMGVPGLIDDELPRSGSAAGYKPSAHVADGSHACWGRTDA
jgi:prophage antirepressor-like protein